MEGSGASRVGGLWMKLELGSAEPAKALQCRFPRAAWCFGAGAGSSGHRESRAARRVPVWSRHDGTGHVCGVAEAR